MKKHVKKILADKGLELADYEYTHRSWIEPTIMGFGCGIEVEERKIHALAKIEIDSTDISRRTDDYNFDYEGRVFVCTHLSVSRDMRHGVTEYEIHWKVF